MTSLADLRHNPFKAAIADPHAKNQFGGWYMSGLPIAAEAMGYLGYDFIVIDIEHTTIEVHDIHHHLQAVNATPAHPVVRMASHDRTAVKHVLDLGATSLYFPFVQTAEQARAIVAACYYPPFGERGFARMHRGSRLTALHGYTDWINDELCVIAQLETPEALARAEEIAGVPGITGLFIGPGDLAVAMGFGGDVNHPEVKAAMAQVANLCRSKNIPLGTVMPTPEAVLWAFSEGFNYCSIGSDLACLINGQKDYVAKTRALMGEAVALKTAPASAY